ncbi:MAG TPA: ACP S-malonyltransferase [Ignavibacteriaceae bacterium]|nr:ACP S-malonyltransferase [Ignavibacteriaceae bacterium]
MTKIGFLFPGQGSQYTGMARDIYENSVEAKEMMTSADDILGINLSGIMFSGPEDKLKQTEFTQPAIFLHSIILANIVCKISPSAAAGHSLGEYSALVSAGSIEFSEAVKLVRIRGKAMQQAGIDNPGTMAAVLGLNPNIVKECCEKASASGIVQCANFNSPGQIVISGSIEGVKKAMEFCKSAGAKLVKELVVSGAFHSPLMHSAQNELIKALDETPFYNARFPVYTNVSAGSVTEKEQLKNQLFRQLTSPVLWEETIRNMVNDGIEEFVEIGPGKVLQGLVKRINPDIKFFGIDKYSELEKYL